MRRHLLVALSGVLGIALGTATTLALRSPPATEPVVESSPVAVAVAEDRGAPHSPQRVLLVWSAGGLPPGFARDVSRLAGVRNLTVVHAGRVDLRSTQSAAGAVVDEYGGRWTVPLDAFAINPRTYRRLVPASARAEFVALRPGSVLLGETSARLRRLVPGDRLLLGGGEDLAVAGVVDDTLVGAAEVVLTRRDGRRLGIRTPRFMLVEYSGRRDRAESAIRDAAPKGTVVRVRGPGETPYLRHGDAVLPQALLKETFGEFTYRPGSGRQFDQDPRWERRNIVQAEIPILGGVRCHRFIVDSLRGAMRELQNEGLAHLVDPGEYQGCWNPRLIAEGGALSRHAWGIAVDLNAGANPTGIGSGQDARLVEVMERWGFTWGGSWLIPDPMHFEYVRPPDP